MYDIQSGLGLLTDIRRRGRKSATLLVGSQIKEQKEAVMYFDKSETIGELKQEYHRLALTHHPDKGGDVSVMQAINKEYGSRLHYLADNPGIDAENGYSASNEYDIGELYRDIINRIVHLSVEIEICGKWIWVSGETYSVKDELKDAGFFWASKKKKWYWRPSEEKYKQRSTTKPMDWIRGTYGSITVNRPSILQIGG